MADDSIVKRGLVGIIIAGIFILAFFILKPIIISIIVLTVKLPISICCFHSEIISLSESGDMVNKSFFLVTSNRNDHVISFCILKSFLNKQFEDKTFFTVG